MAEKTDNNSADLCDHADWLDMHILPRKILLYLRGGKDVTEELEEYMKEFGINYRTEFKSPCG